MTGKGGYCKVKFVLWAKEGYNAVHDGLLAMERKYQWTYVFYGDEVAPTTGTLHVDGYYELPSSRKLKTEDNKFRKTFGVGYGHIELAKGSAGENCDYSEKEGRYTYTSGTPAAQGVRKDIGETINAITLGEVTTDTLCIENPELFHMYGRTLSRAEDIVLRSKFRTEMTEGIWLWGPTATGKSHRAFEGFNPATHYVYKLNEQWQDGYTGQPIVIINDLRNEIKFNHLLLLVDKWPFTVPRRNREPAPFLATKVIVTSSLPPEKLFEGRAKDDDIDQLLRRFKVEELTSVWV